MVENKTKIWQFNYDVNYHGVRYEIRFNYKDGN